jgi:hypothetical protein
MSKKIVVKAQLNCEKCKKRAMETVAGLEGVVSVAADLKDQKITVIGDTDAVCLTASLRKFGYAELLSVGPSKEPEKKPEAKKTDDKKEEKKPAQKPEPANHTYVIIPTSCHHCSDYTYYLSDENPNSCCIV